MEPANKNLSAILVETPARSWNKWRYDEVEAVVAHATTVLRRNERRIRDFPFHLVSNEGFMWPKSSRTVSVSDNEAEMRAYFAVQALVQLITEGGGSFPASVLASLNSPEGFAAEHAKIDRYESMILSVERINCRLYDPSSPSPHD